MIFMRLSVPSSGKPVTTLHYPSLYHYTSNTILHYKTSILEHYLLIFDLQTQMYCSPLSLGKHFRCQWQNSFKTSTGNTCPKSNSGGAHL